MPQEEESSSWCNSNSNINEEEMSSSGVKNLVRGFKSLGSSSSSSNKTDAGGGDEMISDRELAHRKAEEAGKYLPTRSLFVCSNN
ncbi:unnamed protein product [Linum trigynum]|uniref:Uncharacterized protein n=1 Tax=Linum trigynum TaxID=586398 RepID=A0AAV2D2B5_9ROSI